MSVPLFGSLLSKGLMSAAALAAVLGVVLPATAQDAPSERVVDPLPALRWVPASNGAVPLHAIAGGTEDGATVYICRSLPADGGAETRRVGNLRAGGGCSVPQGVEGTATRVRYEVLSGAPWLLAWMRGGGAAPAQDLVVGGAWQGQPTALCQVDHFAGIHSGMVVGDRCMVAASGKTLMADDFRYAAANTSGAATMRWASQSWVPQGALTATGAADGAAVCLAEDGGAWWPGVLRDGVCTAAADQRGMVSALTYQTVVGDPGRVAWTRFADGQPPMFPPRDAVAIGGANPGGAPNRVCRGVVNGLVLPGAVTGDGGCAVVAPNGAVERLATYDVLLYQPGTPQTAGR